MQRNNQDEKAVAFQSAIRGFLVRRQYQINHLANHQLTHYKTFVVGNDPKMPDALDQFHEPRDKIALVGTSGMRAISLACKLGNPIHTPKIIIIDNSYEVQTFWRAMRDFAFDDTRAGTKALFNHNIDLFLSNHQSLIRLIPDNDYSNIGNGVKYLHQDHTRYFTSLFNKYDYDYVRRVIMHTSLIQQSWADADTFVKLKNILAHLRIHKVYMYPSNIVACTKEIATQNAILENIQVMSPVLSIHTDFCQTHHVPENVMLSTDQAPAVMRNRLFSHSSAQSEMRSANIMRINNIDSLLAVFASAETFKMSRQKNT